MSDAGKIRKSLAALKEIWIAGNAPTPEKKVENILKDRVEQARALLDHTQKHAQEIDCLGQELFRDGYLDHGFETKFLSMDGGENGAPAINPVTFQVVSQDEAKDVLFTVSVDASGDFRITNNNSKYNTYRPANYIKNQIASKLSPDKLLKNYATVKAGKLELR